MPELTTERLLLRAWRDADLEPLHAMSQDREVMEHFPKLLDRDETAHLLGRLKALIDTDGYGFWALERRDTGALIGFAGIKAVTFEAPFTPAYEIGWRLARDLWGHGYATEAARAAVAFGFSKLDLAEVVAFLLPANHRSAAVCERLGMTRDPAEDFDHPLFTDDVIAVGGMPQRRHVLYRLRR